MIIRAKMTISMSIQKKIKTHSLMKIERDGLRVCSFIIISFIWDSLASKGRFVSEWLNKSVQGEAQELGMGKHNHDRWGCVMVSCNIFDPNRTNQSFTGWLTMLSIK